MPNSTFDPVSSCSGPAPFSGLDAGPIVPSVLGVNYCLVQSIGVMTPTWRAAIEAVPSTILEVHPEDALLVSYPGEGQCVLLGEIDDTRKACPYLPSHVPFGQLAPIFDPIAPFVPPDLLDADGSILLVAGMHVGEDPAVYKALVDAVNFDAVNAPCTVTSQALLSPLPAAAAAPGQLRVRVTNGGSGTCVRAVVEWLARLEATEVVLAQPAGRNAMDSSNWFTQTGTAPDPLALPPLTYSRTTTKLFANGVTGVGQVVALADDGIDNDECAFVYGPYVSDVTPGEIDPNMARFRPPWAAVSTGSTNPNDLVVGPAPGWRPLHKIIANYTFTNQPTSGSPAWYFDFSGHGTAVAGCAAGDDFQVSAARAGVRTDDALENEAQPDDYGAEIDSHQQADGAAPGAQIIVQKVQGFGIPWAVPVVDMLRQAYDTEPGARAHSNSSGAYLDSGTPSGHAANSYGPKSAEADGQLFRLRDLVMTFASGNQDVGASPPETEFALGSSACKNCISVAGTKAAPDVVVTGDMMEKVTFPQVQMVSGHGPGFPFQIKPDVAAPAQSLAVHFSSGVFEDGSGTGDGGCTYAAGDPVTGTSVAAPTVAGLALDVRQYFADGYYGGGAPNPGLKFIPTNALLKAVLINSTRNLTGRFTSDTGSVAGVRPSYGQGWGAVTLDDTLRFIGDSGAGQERKTLFVLNDAPNGLAATGLINDRRAEILDAFKSAIWEGQIHEFELWPVSQADDLHVTLAWSDVEGNPGAGTPTEPCITWLTGQRPLRNDLDLEIIAPDGKVWRPRPGGWCSPSEDRPRSGTDDLRLWDAGHSILGDAPCPGDGCAGICAIGQDEQDHPQGGPLGVPPFCNFAGRDRHGTVENIFIPASDVVANAGPYTVRVIGYDIQGNGRTAVDARPNFVSSDGNPDFDVISDLYQGYALIASGDITTDHGHMEFLDPLPVCSGESKLWITSHVVLDPLVPGANNEGDPTVGRVVVSASGGDCDEFEVVFWPAAGVGSAQGYQAIVPKEPLPAVIDLAVFGCGASHISPSGAILQGDGIVQVADDGWISARLEFPGIVPAPMASLSAGTRISCRDVALAVATVDDGCDDVANGALNPNELAWVNIDLMDIGTPTVAALWGELLCKNRYVTVEPTSVVFTTGGTIQGRALLRAEAALGGINCPTNVGFELELYGEDGFRDRVFFDVPVDCTPDPTAPLTRPTEVIGDGLLPEDWLWVRKAGFGQVDLALTWDPAPQPVPNPVPSYVYTYDIWEGDLRGLMRNGYSHVLPDDGGFPVSDFCQRPLPSPNLPAILTLRASTDGAWRYYLVTARIPCSSGLGSLDGPWGHPDRNADGLDDVEEIPAGRRLDSACP